MVTQCADIPEHMDIFGDNNSITYFEAFRAVEPMYYRVIFTEPEEIETRRNSFYVTQEFGGEKEFVHLPEDTACFALSSSGCYHGAKFRKGHFKSTAAIYGYLDERRHGELLGRSLEKYRDHAIRLRRPGPVGGPAAKRPYAGV